MKRKYQKVTGWWVYVIKTPNNMYYPGYSGGKNGTKQIFERWSKCQYRNTALEPYIEECGWDNLEKIVLCDGLTEEQAVKIENTLIKLYEEIGCCINKQASGWYYKNNPKEYKKKWHEEHKGRVKEQHKKLYQEHKEEIKERSSKYRKEHPEQIKQWREGFNIKPENKIYNRVHGFNYRHPDKAIETPLEAKQKYLQWGYIPNYIKNDDLV